MSEETGMIGKRRYRDFSSPPSFSGKWTVVCLLNGLLKKEEMSGFFSTSHLHAIVKKTGSTSCILG